MTQDISSGPFGDCEKKHVQAGILFFKSVIYSFAIFGFLFVLLLLASIKLLRQDIQPVEVPSSAIVVVNFDDVYPELRNDDLFSEVSGVTSLSFYDLVRTLNVAMSDNRVKAVAGKINLSSLGLAQIQELRRIISNFRESGKKTYIFSNGFGAFGGGTDEYYLASAFDEIWMQPNSEMGITGLGFEVPFFRKTLDKIGVYPEFYSRHEYKTAMASLTDSKMSVPFKSELEKLGKSLSGAIVSGIAEGRSLREDKVVGLINEAPFSAEKALDDKLIDKTGYWVDFADYIKQENDAEFINVFDYAGSFSEYDKGVPTVALVVVEGIISEGESSVNPLKGEAVTGADTVLTQIEDIAQDDDVKALVLRVNSPGGSYGASSEIWYSLNKLKKEKNIPVIVSMGDYAASGGYFVSLAGDYIFADASTITGSIGVLGGKMVLAGLWEKLGVNWQQVKFGDNAGLLSTARPFTKREKSAFNKSLDNVYKDFTLRVSEARNIPLKELDKLARGRVWSGKEAVGVRLVDELGGLENALLKAKQAAKIGDKDNFRIVYYPKAKTLQEKLQQIMGGKMVTESSLLGNIDILQDEVKTLQRLEYDAVLPPMKIKM